MTVRKPELLPAAALVFRTVRVGFPEQDLVVWGNGLDPVWAGMVASWTQQVGGTFRNLGGYVSHDAWIEGAIQREMEPFWICDTDVVFFDKMHQPEAVVMMAGRHEPEFSEQWTRTRYMERLHTCVMYLDPSQARQGMREWLCRFPKPWRYTAEFPFIRQNFVPVAAAPRRSAEVLFYDTCAGLWHSVGGQPFSEEENGAFEHLHCATYVDCIDPRLPGVKELAAQHAAIYRDPQLARGLFGRQKLVYERCRTSEPILAGEEKGSCAV